jgi:hypothetical protein
VACHPVTTTLGFVTATEVLEVALAPLLATSASVVREMRSLGEIVKKSRPAALSCDGTPTMMSRAPSPVTS